MAVSCFMLVKDGLIRANFQHTPAVLHLEDGTALLVWGVDLFFNPLLDFGLGKWFLFKVVHFGFF